MQAQVYETIVIGEHMWRRALQSCNPLRRKVADDELALPERTRKSSGVGHLKKQTQPS